MKKGAAGDVLIIMIIIFVVAISILISIKVFDETNTALQNAGVIPDNAKSILTSFNDKIGNLFNGMFLFLFVGITIVGMILAARVNVTPAFFIFGILLFVITIFLAAIFTNVYAELGNNSSMVDITAKFNIMNYIMQKLPIFMLIPGTLILVVLYAKMQGGGI